MSTVSVKSIKNAATELNNIDVSDLSARRNALNNLLAATNELLNYDGEIVSGPYYSEQEEKEIVEKANIKDPANLTEKIKNALACIEDIYDNIEKLQDYGAELSEIATNIKKSSDNIESELKQKGLEAMFEIGITTDMYRAKENDMIDEKNIIKDEDVWAGKITFEKQDNGTYLIVKNTEDGEKIYMGYTTKEGKDAYNNIINEETDSIINETSKEIKEEKNENEEKTNQNQDETSQEKTPNDPTKVKAELFNYSNDEERATAKMTLDDLKEKYDIVYSIEKNNYIEYQISEKNNSNKYTWVFSYDGGKTVEATSPLER